MLTLRMHLRPDATERARAGAARWVRARVIPLAGVALIIGQLGWTAILLAHSYFRQDDFVLLGGALRTRLGLGYLMTPDNGHLMPAGLAIIWALGRISLYNWLLASAVIMVLVAAASLALLRALLTLYGPRPGILVLLALYLFAPLGAGTVGWLSAAVKILPLELALFLAVDAHVRYLRAPRETRWRHAAAATVWLLVGMASADQGAVVPLLLFAITVSLAHGQPGPEGSPLRWTSAAWRALAEYRRAWLLYGALLAAYCAIFFARLSASGTALPGPGETTRLYRFAGTLIGTSVVPGALGGPWRWVASEYAQAAPPAGLQYLSWAIAVIVIAVSIARRRSAWSAWAIGLGWVVLADIVPVAVEGFGTFSAATLGATTGYVSDATAVLALCVGLAFLPPADGSAAVPSGAFARSRLVRAVAIAACCVFVASAAVSLPALVAATPSAAARSYIATARAAIRDAPPGTLVVDGPVAAAVLSAGFFGAAADTSRVIEPLAGGRRTRLSWTAAPAGVLARPMMFDDLGRLLPLAVAGPSWVPPSLGITCLQGAAASTRIPLDGSLYRWPWIVRLSYSGSSDGVLVIRLGRGRDQISVPTGTHDVYVPVVGQGNAVSVQLSGTTMGAVCITGVTVGLPQPDPAGKAIPAAVVAG